VHHAILDGWSLSLFLTELVQRSLATLRGEAYTFEEPRSRYRDFIALERATTGDASIRAFWEPRIAGLPVLALPRRRESAPPAGASRIVKTTIEWNAQTVAALNGVAARAGASIKSVLLAAHLAVLSTLANQRDVVTGLIVNGRPEEDGADRVLGLF